MKKRILWIDDQIDMLTSFTYFLQLENYEVETASNGEDALNMVSNKKYDIIFLDQYMPGIDGIETLGRIKEYSLKTPVIMVTKADDKSIIDSALSERVDDYLIKPVNPNQLLATIKRFVDKKRKIQENLGRNYSGTISRINNIFQKDETYSSYAKIHHIMSQWNLTINRDIQTDISNMHSMQKNQLNHDFTKFVMKNYLKWIRGTDAPVMSHTFLDNFIIPRIQKKEKTLFVLIDCLRYDHYLLIETFLTEHFNTKLEMYYSIIPTATPYSRNSIFAGILPLEIARNYPEKWDFTDTMSQNQFEEDFLKIKLRRVGINEESSYAKISTNETLKRYIGGFGKYDNKSLNVLVINIMDVFTHFRSDSDILKDMLPDENSLLAFVSTWFRTSGLLEFFENAIEKDYTIIVSSDHGSIISKEPLLLNTGKDVSINLKYKFGSSIIPQNNSIVVLDNPEDYGLPVPKKTDRWYIATGNGYLVYSTKFNQYKQEYFNTFQHGGISMEEMIMPVGIINAKDS